MDAEDRNGKRRRQRRDEKIADALASVVRALEPLDQEARGRVMRSAAAFLDVEVQPALITRAMGG